MIGDEQQELIRHAILKTLVVCGTLASVKRGAQIASIAADAKLSERAVTLILRHIVREMDPQEQVSNRHFKRLLDDLVKLGKEV